MAGVEVEIKISLARSPEAPIPLLSIPRNDVERLARLPFRWLRYVVFAICGARGDIHDIATGIVDHEGTEVPSDKNEYHYVPLASEQYAFIDPDGWSDRVTSSVQTVRRGTFRNDIIARDGRACVVTGKAEAGCQAAHLIPMSKGDAYIARVMELRSSRGESIEGGINGTRNGVLLDAGLHLELGRADVAFVMTTPNGLLRPEDIRRFSRGDPREEYITLQQFKPEYYDPDYQTALLFLEARGNANLPRHAFDLGANVDALFQGVGTPLPHPVILDYFYGIAAYKCWRIRDEDGGVPEILRNYRQAHYIEFLSPDATYEPGSNDEDSSSECGPSTCPPSTSDFRSTGRHECELSEIMDELNVLLMYASGTTPEAVAERNRKRMEQREREAQEAGSRKVMDWMGGLVY